MMTAPINQMIDALDLKCTRCGVGRKIGCDCWAPITLRCPKCHRTQESHRDDSDPPGTAVVEAPCNRCDNGGDKPETLYFDAKGRQWDGETFENPAFNGKRTLDR